MSNNAGPAPAPADAVFMCRVEATTIGFSEDPAPADTGFRLAVIVTFFVKRSLEFRWQRQRPYVLEQEYVEEGSDCAATFLVRDLSTLQSDGACRSALRGMLAELSQVRELNLPEDEWDALVPADVVPQIVRVANGSDASHGFTFFFAMEVNRRSFIHGELALLMVYKEWELGRSNNAGDCRICLESLEGEPAVELPICKHQFHRRCISTLFSMDTKCPLCRDDVMLSALPEFLDL